MNLNRVRTIFRKDIRDAMRDSRVLIALVVPFMLGLLYNVTMGDEEPRPRATIAWFAADETILPGQIQRLAGDGVVVTLDHRASEADVRQFVDTRTSAVGLLIPAGFDTAVGQGERPELQVLLPGSPSVGAQYVTALIEPALRQMAGQAEPATLRVETLVAEAQRDPIERLGISTYFVLVSVLMLVVVICLFVVPMLLAEERERKTLDALVLIASNTEVVAAKALVGVAYVLVAVPLLMALTQLSPNDLLLYVVGIGGLALALIGFGLLLGRLFSATQLYSWGGILILPFIAPAFVVGVPAPDGVVAASLAFPTSHAMRLAANGLAGEAIFAHAALSTVILTAWTLLGFGVLLWHLSRREAG
jgi:ABC-2 type transport system permease protein